jgi:hypothetical protein
MCSLTTVSTVYADWRQYTCTVCCCLYFCLFSAKAYVYKKSQKLFKKQTLVCNDVLLLSANAWNCCCSPLLAITLFINSSISLSAVNAAKLLTWQIIKKKK